RHVHLDVAPWTKRFVGGHIGPDDELAQEGRKRGHLLHRARLLRPERGAARDFDFEITTHRQVAGQSIPLFEPGGLYVGTIRAAGNRGVSAEADLAQAAALPASAVGRQMQSVASQRDEDAVARSRW